jgi:hypothetical protein
MFDLMQYALIFYDFQLILAQMGVSLNPRSARDGKKERGALEISGGLTITKR